MSKPYSQNEAFASRIISEPVAGITLVDGWELRWHPESDSDGFETRAYVARGPYRDVHLDVSRFRFTPSQDRFAWLVKAGFPPRPTLGPWDDTDIEARMAQQVAA